MSAIVETAEATAGEELPKTLEGLRALARAAVGIVPATKTAGKRRTRQTRLGSLPKAHFVSELTSGKSEVLLQRVWEMMLARHLDALG